MTRGVEDEMWLGQDCCKRHSSWVVNCSKRCCRDGVEAGGGGVLESSADSETLRLTEEGVGVSMRRKDPET
jgi:hypothetical protein